MRSRYAAFARGEAEYLVRTLHPTHPDLGLARGDLLRSLRGARTRLSYPSLSILDDRRTSATAEVLFAAGIVEGGRDASFVELSDFAREGREWLYVSGILVPASELGRDPAGLTIDAFLTLASGE
jgi:SEC-C motif-containing protein